MCLQLNSHVKIFIGHVMLQPFPKYGPKFCLKSLKNPFEISREQDLVKGHTLISVTAGGQFRIKVDLGNMHWTYLYFV
jgi:hypothetical protein